MRAALSDSFPIDTQTSVYNRSAPLAAFSMSSVQEIFPPARFNSSAGGWNFFGAAIRSSNPSLDAAQIQEIGTLQAPSPTNVTTLPTIGPCCSLNVKMSARIWHGCSSSVNALIVGIFA